MAEVTGPQDLYPDRGTVARIDELLRTQWMLDLQPDHREIRKRFADHDRWAEKLDEANERAASKANDAERVDEREIWRLMSRPDLFALKGCSRRHYILDGIALGVGLALRFDLSTPILDAGCHLGVTASVLSKVLPNDIVGIDPIGAAIDKAKTLNAGSERLTFVRSGLPWVTDRRFGLILCYDVFDHLTQGEQRRALRSLAELTIDGGFVVVSGPMLNEEGWSSTAAGWLAEDRLGYVTCDVHGGYGGAPPQWIANTVVVLRKGDPTSLPNNLMELSKREWENHFTAYANAPGTPRREATQAFERTRRSAQSTADADHETA